MIGTLDIYSGVYIHITIVYMSLQTCTLGSNQAVNCLSKVSTSPIVYKGCMGSVTTW